MGVVLLVLAAMVCPLASAEVQTQTLVVSGQEAMVIRPGEPTRRLVLYIHGAGGDHESIIENAEHQGLTEALLRRGFAVAASDAHGESNWGIPASVADYVRLADRLGYPRIYILAESMGGLDGVQLIDRLHPEAWAGIYPVCNLDSLYRNALFAESIDQTWHGPPPARLSPVKAVDVKGLPVIMWSSPEDTYVPQQQNSGQCAKWMTKRGARVQMVETHGEHGDISNFRPLWLARFFAANSRR